MHCQNNTRPRRSQFKHVWIQIAAVPVHVARLAEDGKRETVGRLCFSTRLSDHFWRSSLVSDFVLRAGSRRAKLSKV